MTFRVQIHPSALRELQRLPRPAFAAAIKAIIGLVTEPRPPGARALVGEPAGTIRIRLGDYRVVHVVSDADNDVVVYRVAHCREVYDR
ncbi:MAG TPA: type II toxin-antitoxin system RelE/ParE family toxin [Pilimelia sp.]|nr:type II toxin-antitoxin system RelE/ParE family toxin [Pilimelia sp.]